MVVPILNEARYLRESMDSLMLQDYQPLEIIVYDAGLPPMARSNLFRAYPVEVIVEPGLGQMAAINRGWRRTLSRVCHLVGRQYRYSPVQSADWWKSFKHTLRLDLSMPTPMS